MTTPRSSLSRTVRFGLVCAAAWLAMVASLAPPAAAQSPTPPLTELVAAPGSAPQSVDLRWQTPLFEPDSAGGARVECTYDFRYSGAYITEQNFAAGLPVTGAIPDVVWVGLLDVQLDLNVSAENNSGYPVYTVTWDRPYLRAWLYVGADVPWHYGAVGKGLKDEAIKFTITKDSNPQWSIGTTVYTDNHGYAEWKPGDICDNAAGEWFTFEAEWNQHAVELRNGAVVQAVEGAEDTQRLILYDATDVVSPPYNMNEGGGELAWDQSSWITAFFPANATDEDVEISCSEPLAPPPPDGMPPGVPGAMVAFEITKSTGPQLLLPVEIRVQYPPEKLLEYGGVAECALEAYRYEPGRGVWVHIPERLGINRADHAITFATTTLGLFAIAAETDGDFDGGGDFQELEWGTSPALADTDDDGLPDGDEVWWSGGDPIEPLKVHGSDQRGLGEGLISQPHYWIAGRIVAGRAASPVSTCAYIGPPIEVTYGEDWSGPALFKSDAAWGDFDEDLDADLLLMGHDGAQAVTILYRNDPPGTLAPDTVNVLTGLFAGSADWGDLDNDGDLDLLTTGSDGTQRRTIVYRNHPKGRLTADGSHGLPAVAFSDAAWGDIDKDGDVDLAFTGEESVQGRYARVYRNDKGTLTLIANMPGIYRSSCALGDVDLDGDLDVAFCGYDGGGLMTYLFENGEEGFDLFPLEFPGVREGSLHLVDADLDGDLDFFLTGADWGTGYALLYRHGGIAAEVDVGPGQPTGRTRVWLLTPSPARGEVALRYALAGDGPVRLAVYDVAGWCMRTLVEGPVAAGVYEATWDGRTDSGAEAGAGVFFYRLEGDGRVAGGRLVRVR